MKRGTSHASLRGGCKKDHTSGVTYEVGGGNAKMPSVTFENRDEDGGGGRYINAFGWAKKTLIDIEATDEGGQLAIGKKVCGRIEDYAYRQQTQEGFGDTITLNRFTTRILTKKVEERRWPYRRRKDAQSSLRAHTGGLRIVRRTRRRSRVSVKKWATPFVRRHEGEVRISKKCKGSVEFTKLVADNEPLVCLDGRAPRIQGHEAAWM